MARANAPAADCDTVGRMSTGIEMDLPQVPLAHISDTHLGHEAHPALTPRGYNQRGQDILRALDNCVRDILAWDPPLVIHSGDVFDKSTNPVRYMLEMRRQLSRLASPRPDGTRRQIVVIAGNHDQSYSRKDPCCLELFAGIPGVHIVTTGHQVVSFEKLVDAGEADGRLRDVLVS
jgi:DNA repair exonuclease SbcCD nuclease subunit